MDICPPVEVASGLVRKANIIIGLHDDPNGTLADWDGRGSLLDVGKEFGLDAAQIDRIRRSTGYVICPVEKNPKARFFIGSGFLALSNDQILTSRHGPTTSLRPLALLTGSVEKVGDNQPWDFNLNSTVGIMLDSSFNKDLIALAATSYGTKLFDSAE